MKLVILDSYALQEGDLNWSALHQWVDEIETYPRTTAAQIIPRLQDADFAIVNKANITDTVLDACPKLKWIGVTATGTDTLDIAACRRHGVPVANVPGYSTHSVAQMALALLLALCQNVVPYNASTHDAHWQLAVPSHYGFAPMMELQGKTIGLVGYGAIGQQMAKSCAALGMRVLCTTRTVRSEWQSHAVEFVPLDMLLATSDCLSLHCPATPETTHLLCAQTLAKCKRGVRIVNTARGALVDEQAMAQALHSGHVGGYGAEVVAKEPICKTNLLLHTPNTILTPHIAWATPDALARLAACVIDNFVSFLNNSAKNVVN